MLFLSVPWMYVFPSFGGSTAETRLMKVELRASVVRRVEIQDLEITKSRAMVVAGGTVQIQELCASHSLFCVKRVVS